MLYRPVHVVCMYLDIKRLMINKWVPGVTAQTPKRHVSYELASSHTHVDSCDAHVLAQHA
jgi:hypothetical protein